MTKVGIETQIEAIRTDSLVLTPGLKLVAQKYASDPVFRQGLVDDFNSAVTRFGLQLTEEEKSVLSGFIGATQPYQKLSYFVTQGNCWGGDV